MERTLSEEDILDIVQAAAVDDVLASYPPKLRSEEMAIRPPVGACVEWTAAGHTRVGRVIGYAYYAEDYGEGAELVKCDYITPVKKQGNEFAFPTLAFTWRIVQPPVMYVVEVDTTDMTKSKRHGGQLGLRMEEIAGEQWPTLRLTGPQPELERFLTMHNGGNVREGHLYFHDHAQEV